MKILWSDLAFKLVSIGFVVILPVTEAFARVRSEDPIQALPMAVETATGNTLMTFTTDGCSNFSEDLFDAAGIMHECCTQHDFRYWLGGTAADRKDADKQLMSCVYATGQYAVAHAMYRAVRIFGRPLTGKSYQWGYGWQFDRGYQPIPTSAEMTMVPKAQIDFHVSSEAQPEVNNFCEALQKSYDVKEGLILTAKRYLKPRPVVCQ